MIIDIDQHWYPEEFYEDESFQAACLRIIPRAYGENVEVLDLPGTSEKKITISKPKGYDNLNYERKAADTGDRLKAMDKANVDLSILRWPIWPEWLTLELARKANDALARDVKAHPDRFLGLGIVPPWDDKECLDELDRCINELGFVGVNVAAHYGTRYLDSEVFRPFFKKINQLGVPVAVGHTPLPVDYEHIYEFANLRRQYGRCMDQMISVSRILFSGMLEELPNLRFVHSMMAGGLFAYVDLLTPKKSTIPGEKNRFDTSASDKVRGFLEKNIYSDIANGSAWGKIQLECAVRIMGPEHVLFGSCYPVSSEWLYKGVEYVKDLPISEKDKSLVLSENAIKLFNIKV